jgi:hypothetical protein
MAAPRGADNARPDLRVTEVPIHERFEGGSIHPIIQRETDRSRLSTSPAEPVDSGIALIESARPCLTGRVLAAGRDALVQSECPGRGPHEVEDFDWLAHTYDADMAAGAPIDEAAVPERFGHGSEQRGGRIPNRSVRVRARRRTVMIEPDLGKRAEGPLGIPSAMRRVEEAHEKVSRSDLVQPGPRPQDRRRQGERQGR